MVLIKKLPPNPENSIAIIATSSSLDFLKEFGLYVQFSIKLEIPRLALNVAGENEIGRVWEQKSGIKMGGSMGLKSNFKISIKKLLFTFNIMQNMKQKDSDSNFREAIRIVEGDEGDDLTTEITF